MNDLSISMPPDVDWTKAYLILSKQICSCSRPALLHHGYMTNYLEDSRNCSLHIQRIWQRYNARLLSRSTLLLDQQQRCHVVAKINISLQPFSPLMKQQLIESNLPFGHILDQAGIKPNFKRRHYFTLPEVLPAQNIDAYRNCCGYFFGRFHEMTDQYGQLLAAIYEVLP